MAGNIRVGTASWADPGFVKDWYPPQLPSQQRLAWYARHFSFVELNSSFYAVPERGLVERWERSTPAGFLFDVKLHRSLSRHAFEWSALPKELQGISGTARGKAVLTPKLETALIASFLDAVEPLERAGKFGAFLLQLSPAFSPGKHRLAELDPLLRQLAPRAVAVELRNRNWMTKEDDAAGYFASRDATLVSVDTPRSEHFTVMPPTDTVTNPALSYLRLHGRNEKGYLTGKTVEERFDHQYSGEELEEVAGRVRRLSEQAREVHVVFNNNRSDYAPEAARRFRVLLGQIPPQPEHEKMEQEDFRL
jgi:uncharacterized protein YecE (DUF72 family)